MIEHERMNQSPHDWAVEAQAFADMVTIRVSERGPNDLVTQNVETGWSEPKFGRESRPGMMYGYLVRHDGENLVVDYDQIRSKRLTKRNSEIVGDAIRGQLYRD